MFDVTLRDILSPSGRADRLGLAKGAALLVAAQTMIAALDYLHLTSPAILLPAQMLLFWISLVLIAKRLHDLGRGITHAATGLMLIAVLTVIAAFLIARVFGEDVLAPGKPGFTIMVAIAFAPLAAAAIWLHFGAGDTQENRYGPPPGDSGFNDRTGRRSPEPAGRRA